MPGSNLCPAARGFYWEGIVAHADVLRRGLFLKSSQLHLPPESRRHFFVEYIPIKEDSGPKPVEGATNDIGRGDWQVDVWERHGGQYARLREKDLVSSDENELKCNQLCVSNK